MAVWHERLASSASRIRAGQKHWHILLPAAPETAGWAGNSQGLSHRAARLDSAHHTAPADRSTLPPSRPTDLLYQPTLPSESTGLYLNTPPRIPLHSRISGSPRFPSHSPLATIVDSPARSQARVLPPSLAVAVLRPVSDTPTRNSKHHEREDGPRGQCGGSRRPPVL